MHLKPKNSRPDPSAGAHAMRCLKAALLKALTKRKNYPFQPEAAKSFVFLRYDRIGDLIVSLPLVKSLREGFPATKMILIGSEANAPVGEYCGLFDEIIVKPQGRLFVWMLILWGLRQRKISVTFDLNHSVTPHTLFACLAINSKHVATPYKDGRWGVSGRELELFDLMPAQHADKYNRPLAETYLDIARLLRCPTDSVQPYPLRPSMNRTETERTVVLNHRGSRASMRLPDDHLQEIVKIIRTIQPSYTVKMVPERSEYDHIANLMKNQDNVLVMIPSPSIIQVIEAVRVAALVITPDTALVHIASAFAKPLIAVYANEPALFSQWKPLNTAPTVTVFSASNKSLQGYNFDQLAEAIADMANELAH